MDVLNIYTKIKTHFADKSLIDDMFIEKGIEKIVAKIPIEIIEFLAGFEPAIRQVVIGAIVEIIHAMVPKAKKDKIGPLLVSFNREINDRVKEYAEKKAGGGDDNSSDDPEAETEAAKAKQIDRRMYILSSLADPAFGAQSEVMMNNLNKMVAPTTGRLLTLKAINPEEYEKRLWAKLCAKELTDEAIVNLLADGNQPLRELFVIAAIGKLEAPKPKPTFRSVLNDLKAAAAEVDRELAISSSTTTAKTAVDNHISTRTAYIESQKGKWWSIL
jgi:hypothetical protein